jgi:hypothetical protein
VSPPPTLVSSRLCVAQAFSLYIGTSRLSPIHLLSAPTWATADHHMAPPPGHAGRQIEPWMRRQTLSLILSSALFFAIITPGPATAARATSSPARHLLRTEEDASAHGPLSYDDAQASAEGAKMPDLTLVDAAKSASHTEAGGEDASLAEAEGTTESGEDVPRVWHPYASATAPQQEEKSDAPTDDALADGEQAPASPKPAGDSDIFAAPALAPYESIHVAEAPFQKASPAKQADSSAETAESPASGPVDSPAAAGVETSGAEAPAESAASAPAHSAEPSVAPAPADDAVPAPAPVDAGADALAPTPALASAPTHAPAHAPAAGHAHAVPAPAPAHATHTTASATGGDVKSAPTPAPASTHRKAAAPEATVPAPAPAHTADSAVHQAGAKHTSAPAPAPVVAHAKAPASHVSAGRRQGAPAHAPRHGPPAGPAEDAAETGPATPEEQAVAAALLLKALLDSIAAGTPLPTIVSGLQFTFLGYMNDQKMTSRKEIQLSYVWHVCRPYMQRHHEMSLTRNKSLSSNKTLKGIADSFAYGRGSLATKRVGYPSVWGLHHKTGNNRKWERDRERERQIHILLNSLPLELIHNAPCDLPVSWLGGARLTNQGVSLQGF